MAASIYSLTRYSNCDSSNSMVTELAIDAYYPHLTSPTYLVLFIMCIETGRFFIEGSFESFWFRFEWPEICDFEHSSSWGYYLCVLKALLELEIED